MLVVVEMEVVLTVTVNVCMAAHESDTAASVNAPAAVCALPLKLVLRVLDARAFLPAALPLPVEGGGSVGNPEKLVDFCGRGGGIPDTQ